MYCNRLGRYRSWHNRGTFSKWSRVIQDTTKILSYDKGCLGRDSNRAHLESRSTALSLDQQARLPSCYITYIYYREYLLSHLHVAIIIKPHMFQSSTYSNLQTPGIYKNLWGRHGEANTRHTAQRSSLMGLLDRVPVCVSFDSKISDRTDRFWKIIGFEILTAVSTRRTKSETE
jgi:hypothetical protein